MGLYLLLKVVDNCCGTVSCISAPVVLQRSSQRFPLFVTKNKVPRPPSPRSMIPHHTCISSKSYWQRFHLDLPIPAVSLMTRQMSRREIPFRVDPVTINHFPTRSIVQDILHFITTFLIFPLNCVFSSHREKGRCLQAC